MAPARQRPKRRLALAGVAAAVVVVVAVGVLFLWPVPHTHSVHLFFAASEITPSERCVATVHSETFPSWFSGSATMNWTASGGPVTLWVNETQPTHGVAAYTASGTEGAGTIPIQGAGVYAFTVENCNPLEVTMNVTLSVPYSSSIL